MTFPKLFGSPPRRKTDHIVYTAIVGDYPIKRTDVRCFTGQGLFRRPVMEAKRYKVLPHLIYPKKEVTIWVDGNLWLKANPDDAIERFLGDADMAVFQHPQRRTVW